MQVDTAPMRGTYEELEDVAEDIFQILKAKANNRLDLNPVCERWFVDLLEDIDLTLSSHGIPHRGTAPRLEAVAAEGRSAA